MRCIHCLVKALALKEKAERTGAALSDIGPNIKILPEMRCAGRESGNFDFALSEKRKTCGKITLCRIKAVQVRFTEDSYCPVFVCEL